MPNVSSKTVEKLCQTLPSCCCAVLMLHGVYTGAWLLLMLLPSAANAAKAALSRTGKRSGSEGRNGDKM